jgi:transposase
MSKRKHYSPEYKREPAELVRHTQSSCRKIGLEVGVNPNVLT